MTRLPQMTLQFNRKLKISNEGDELSSDTRQFLFREFDEKLGFTKTIFEYLQLKDERSFHAHQNKQLFRQKIYQMTSGYHEDDAADQLTHDPVFTQVIGTPALASQTSLSRFINVLMNNHSINFKPQIKHYLIKFMRLAKLTLSFLIWIQHTQIHMKNKNNQLTMRITER